jgi:uncharacterized membrane protein
MTPDPQLPPRAAEERQLRSLTHLVYGLQALFFLTVVMPVAGVIINYARREEAAGTLYESHFRWQIRTFWWSLLWSALGTATFLLGVGALILFAAMAWYIYRIVKGWLRLSENKPMY